MMNKGIWVLVIVAFLVGVFGGYYWEKTKLTSQMMSMQSDMQKKLDSEKMKNDQMVKDKMIQESKGNASTGTSDTMMKK